ncbi:MAG: DUF4276 family protein [Myxococcaceae bacterium]|nr:DUF4276 family protein [Myxococcaceae bacterium]
MKLLSLAGEGKGETTALPALTARILAQCGRVGWRVPRDAIRIPRGLLVDERVPAPLRPARDDGFQKALAVAQGQKASALVVLVDADDDCPASFGRSGLQFFRNWAGRAVMAVREFETWLLLSFSPAELGAAGVRQPERIRDAKKALQRLVPGYLPTAHQRDLSRRIAIDELRQRSRSFDKYVRSVLEVTS